MVNILQPIFLLHLYDVLAMPGYVFRRSHSSKGAIYSGRWLGIEPALIQ